MTTTTLPIQGTFDIAMARNVLRRTGQSYKWPPQFAARASAALSALAELGLFAQTAQMSCFYLKFDVLNCAGGDGVEFSCEIKTHGQSNNYMNYARLQLERASDEIEVEQAAGLEKIKVRVWIK